jgi:hypothetical protein
VIGPIFIGGSPTTTNFVLWFLVLLEMDDEAGHATTTTAPGDKVASVGLQQQLAKEGWLIKLSGYLVKSPKAPTPLFNLILKMI